MPATGPTRCCETTPGFDPERVREACGFDRYLGQSEELACVHRFADEDGREHDLRVTPILGLELDAIAAQHVAGGSGALIVEPGPAATEPDPLADTSNSLANPDPLADPNAENPDTRTSDDPDRPDHPSIRWLASSPTRHWVAVERGGAIRRLSWASASCDASAMAPVIDAMATGDSTDAPTPTPLPRLYFDPSPVSAATDSLLGAAATLTAPTPSPTSPSRGLPLGANALGAALIRSAAAGELESFSALFEPDARWGLPDRRQLSGRPLTTDPDAAMHALRSSAARLPAGAPLHCPKPDRRSAEPLERGAAIMWCLWVDPAQLDLIVIGLRGHVEQGRAGARVHYLGLFPDPPLAPVAIPGEPPPPPVVPTPALMCGDPHARVYPGLCPEAPAPVEDDPVDESAPGDPDPPVDAAALEAKLDASERAELDASEPRHRGERVHVAPTE